LIAGHPIVANTLARGGDFGRADLSVTVPSPDKSKDSHADIRAN
jgi:hypothetical protein